jgi:hypothetical protein
MRLREQGVRPTTHPWWGGFQHKATIKSTFAHIQIPRMIELSPSHQASLFHKFYFLQSSQKSSVSRSRNVSFSSQELWFLFRAVSVCVFLAFIVLMFDRISNWSVCKPATVPLKWTSIPITRCSTTSFGKRHGNFNGNLVRVFRALF